jgi:hypothetical protein
MVANVLIEFAELHRTRPAMGAPAAVVADWYRAKAELHRRIARGTAGAEQAHELGYALAAMRHANRLHAASPAGQFPAAA